MAYGISIASMARPHLLGHNAIAFHQCGVQTVGRRIGGIFIFLGRIIGFCLCLTDSLVEVTGRCQQQVLTVGLIHPFGQHSGVKDDRKEFVTECIYSLSIGQG